MVRLLLLLLIGGTGAAVAAWGLPRGGRAARIGVVVGVVALVAMTGDAFLLRPARLTDTGQPITGIFDAHLVPTAYLRLVIGLWGLTSLVLVFGTWLLGGLARLRGLLPATLAAMTGGTVAMASADLSVGAAAAAATGLASLLVVLAAEGAVAVAAAARELRVTLVGGAVLLASLAVVPIASRLVLLQSGVGLDEAAEAAGGVAGPTMGLVTLAVALVVVGRWGMLPLHVRVSRLTDIVPPETLPLLLAWVPVPLTVVAFATVDRLIAPLALPFDGERIILVLLAVGTMAGASLAAYFHDDLRHAVGYLVVADAGLLLLAIAALDPQAWGPGRAWVVALAASKTALGAWAAVVENRFETRSIPELRGWVRRAPLLAAGLVVTIFATFGIPGWVAFEARTSLATLATDAPWDALLIVAGFLTLPTYLRLVGIGLGRVTSKVDRAAPEHLSLRPRPQEMLPVEMEGVDTPGPASRPVAAGTPPAPAGTGDVTGDGIAAATDDGETMSGRRMPRVRRRGLAGPTAGGPVTGASDLGRRFVAGLRRNRTELLSGTVLALAVLAVLTSYGALDLAGAAAEPAPILLGRDSD
jgi:NADH:ubiquinone oxidoreductase subunit 2 (subunit N)